MNTRLMMSYRQGRENPWAMWQRVTHNGEIVEELFPQEFKSQLEAIQASKKFNLLPPYGWKQLGGGDLWEGARVKKMEGSR